MTPPAASPGRTPRTLAVLSAILLAVGATVIAPEAGMLALVLALLAVLPALALGGAWLRLVAAVLALLEVALIANLYPRVFGP